MNGAALERPSSIVLTPGYLSGYTYLPKLFPLLTKRRLVRHDPQVCEALERALAVRTVHPAEIVTIIGRRRVVPLASSGPNLQVLAEVVQGIRR